MKKVLLLNSSFEALTFISEVRAWKLVFRDCVDIIDTWNDYSINFNSKIIKNPSILKLKIYKHILNTKFVYSKQAIVKRDNSTCQYCMMPLAPHEITIDHIHPKSKGGRNSFYNCVVACPYCNAQKGSLSLEESGLKLKSIPDIPKKMYVTKPKVFWFDGWEDYL